MLPPLVSQPVIQQKSRTLEWALFGVSRLVNVRVRTTLLPEEDPLLYDEALLVDEVRRVRVELETHVLREHIADEVFHSTVEVPATWWDHWKDDHAPAWLIRRHPVRLRSIPVDVQVQRFLNYPEATITAPDFGRAYRFEQLRCDR